MVKAAERTPGTGLLERLIAFSARNWLLTVLVVSAAAAWGYRSLINAPLDAIPDLSDVQVIVFTEWPGRSPDLVEDQITYPLTTTLLAAPGVHSFAIALIVGVIVATYSSIYISTGLAIVLGISREDLLPPKEEEIDQLP